MLCMSRAAQSNWSWRLSLTFPSTSKVWKMWNQNRQAMNTRCAPKEEPPCVYWGLMRRNGWSQSSSRGMRLPSFNSTTRSTTLRGILWRKLKTGPVFSRKTVFQNNLHIFLNSVIFPSTSRNCHWWTTLPIFTGPKIAAKNELPKESSWNPMTRPLTLMSPLSKKRSLAEKVGPRETQIVWTNHSLINNLSNNHFFEPTIF